ncbi:MAPEG family protein [Pseudomonas sp. LRF_L74]|uniref:MAPEG family protein n=1 Tax=Pseudomonas sp. LRF_L74 TaxID=3369422 RepID=UPI003F5E8377
MTLAYWCVLIAIFLPYVATLTAKAIAGGLAPQHNHHPRAFLAGLEGRAARANSAQLNGFETNPAFFAAVIIAHLAGGAAQSTVDALAVAFVISRVLYLICYVLDWATLRSLVWFAGLGIIVSLFVASA